MSNSHIKYALLLMHVFVCVMLLSFYHYSWTSYSLMPFAGLCLLVTLGCFYRPRWAFWFFVGLLPFEALSLTEDILPLSLRPYQVVGGALLLSIMINFLIQRTSLRLPSPRILDGLILMILFGGLIGSVFASDTPLSFRVFLILCTFAGMYFIARVMVTKLTHLRMPVKFLSISAICITLYGILQNVAFLAGDITTAVMPGRPNSTFSEADWFGMFLAFTTACCVSLWQYFFGMRSIGSHARDTLYMIALWASQTLFFIGLILSVARSAWVSVACIAIVYVIFVLYRRNYKDLQYFLFFFFGSFFVAYLIVVFTGLSRFDLFSRAQSTSSGLQEITISCERSASCSDEVCSVPHIIEDVSELSKIGCQFIDLEEIESERLSGMVVTTTNRPDPNIEIRKVIFANSVEQIKEHPLVGIGWGSIGPILGEDGSGTSLNSSNVFLQVWLGSGILGLVGLLGAVVALLVRSLSSLREIARGSSEIHCREVAYRLFILLGGVAIIVSNLFNAGLLIGFIWVYLGCTQIINSTPKNEK